MLKRAVTTDIIPQIIWRQWNRIDFFIAKNIYSILNQSSHMYINCPTESTRLMKVCATNGKCAVVQKKGHLYTFSKEIFFKALFDMHQIQFWSLHFTHLRLNANDVYRFNVLHFNQIALKQCISVFLLKANKNPSRSFFYCKREIMLHCTTRKVSISLKLQFKNPFFNRIHIQLKMMPNQIPHIVCVVLCWLSTQSSLLQHK